MPSLQFYVNELISNIYVDCLPSREGLPFSPSPSEIGHVRSAPRNLMKKVMILILKLDVANMKHTKPKSNIYLKHKTDKAELMQIKISKRKAA